VISPLLANIYLHPLDELMTIRGHRITRYADDFVICCKSRKGAERVLKTIHKLLENELGLKIQPEKTKIVNNLEEPFVFLGHEFKMANWMIPSQKAMKKFKERWGNYFGHGHVKGLFLQLDAWIRRRLRMVQ
jgi:RNA-directed DNA polymerase